MGSTIIEQDFPYDILRRGQRDASRHNKRVKDAAKKQIREIVSQQDIISADKNKKVKVNLKHLDQYRFIHNRDRLDNVGRDEFDDLEPGEIIYQPTEGQGGSSAGDEDGLERFEAEFTIEEITNMLMEDLKLPNFEDKQHTEIVSDILEYTDIKKTSGIFACLDKKKTILANLIRKTKMKLPKNEKIPIINDDLRFRTWNITKEKHSNAVVFLMLDRSGSMETEKIYAVKALYFWIVQFLKQRYSRVEIKFIAHDTKAYEMNEKDFFSVSYDGGTKISSAYKLCREIIKYNYPSDKWNIYCFHSSDGDSFGNDAVESAAIVKEIIDFGASLFAYAEIQINSMNDSDSDLFFEMQQMELEGLPTLCSIIYELGDIYHTLKHFLSKNRVTNAK